ncbi:unnamed protein product [Urochloa decumbens]|uniref:Uncharacterized protein n=1 Tax=Urochloa decumbens TaxID=240449 RepID=A0ABC9F6A9_9POAL
MDDKAAHHGRNDAVGVVCISELVSSMTRELDYYWSLGEPLDDQLSPCMLYKVQQHIREVDRLAYEPFVVSVGPYHHGATAVQDIEKRKWGYLDFVLKLNCTKSLLDYLNEMDVLAQKARSCYSEDIVMDNEEFLQMLLLDGCFLLVALGGTTKIFESKQESSSSTVEEIHGENEGGCQENTESKGSEQGQDQVGQWFIKSVNHDLVLLENQIPFFIVKKLYELVSEGVMAAPPVEDGIVKNLEIALRFYPKAIQETNRPKHFHHLLHVCHIYFKPSKKPDEDHHYHVAPQYLKKFLSFGRKYLKLRPYRDDMEQSSSFKLESDYLESGQQLNRWRRVAQYLQAGVKFKKREYDNLDPHSLLDIKFSNGVMELPCLVIDEHTGTLFRNLIAFEQTCPQFGDDFTAYIVFLSQLTSMPEDVTLLACRGIVVHHLEADEMALCQTLEAHYQSRLNRWMAWLWLNHFSNPWLGLAAFAAAVVLVCTVVQTVFSILAYIKPPT